MNLRQLDSAVARLLGPLKRKVSLMVGRAVIEAITDTTKIQSLKLSMLPDQSGSETKAEVGDDVESFQHYGFTSRPFKDAEAIVLSVGGRRSHLVVVATDDAERRPKDLAEGDAALYTGAGKLVHAKQNGDVDLGAVVSGFVAMATETKSEIEALRDTVDTFVGTYNGHSHTGTMASACTAGGATGTTVTTALIGTGTGPAAVGDVAATKVKAE